MATLRAVVGGLSERSNHQRRAGVQPTMTKLLFLIAIATACTASDGRDPHEWVAGPDHDAALACAETSLAGQAPGEWCSASSPWGTEHRCPSYDWEGELGCCVEGPENEGGHGGVAIYWLPCSE